jgi:hypothetical protein
VSVLNLVERCSAQAVVSRTHQAQNVKDLATGALAEHNTADGKFRRTGILWDDKNIYISLAMRYLRHRPLSRYEYITTQQKTGKKKYNPQRLHYNGMSHTDALQSKLSLWPLLGDSTMLFQLEVHHSVEPNVNMIMNDALVRIWKWSIVSYSTALSRHSAGWRKPRKLQSSSIGISPNYEQQPRIRVIRSAPQIWLISEVWVLTSVAESAQL